MRDVARAAGVSSTAVSSALHGTGTNVRISEETAEKIRQAARELNYSPNNVAKIFRRGRTGTVGVVFQHFNRLSESNPYYPQLLNGVMAALFPAEYTLALCPKLVRDGDIGAMLDGRFDGVLWARPDFTEANVATLRNARTPMVMLHAPPGSAEGVPTFCCDNEGAMRLAVDHLAQIGHRNLTFLLDDVNEHTAEGRARTSAFRQAVERAGLTSGVFVWDEKVRSLEEFRMRNPDCTAIVCFSDTLAGELLNNCRQTGINVPRDISVVGFDSSTFCDQTVPRLTSVHQQVEKMAFEATTLLLSLIEGKTSRDSLSRSSSLYACSLDVRDSTCPPSLKKIIP